MIIIFPQNLSSSCGIEWAVLNSKRCQLWKTPIHVLRQTLPPTGIVKFNEVYLGEAGADGSEYQDGARSPQSGAGAGGGPLTLEQYIGNAREALGVDSHYSR